MILYNNFKVTSSAGLYSRTGAATFTGDGATQSCAIGSAASPRVHRF
jgi:hypothetical protein